MISYGAANPKFADKVMDDGLYKPFSRVVPSYIVQNIAVLGLVTKFGWSSIGCLLEANSLYRTTYQKFAEGACRLGWTGLAGQSWLAESKHKSK
jgi:hypothetical protein